MIGEQLIKVQAPTFVAGLVAYNDQIVKAAPIVRWAVGRSVEWFEQKARARGWKVELVS